MADKQSKLVIAQVCSSPFASRDDFEDWVAGQKAIREETGFLFGIYEVSTGNGMYYYEVSEAFNPETLVPGQFLVAVSNG
jgi:hypothetical protein